MNLQYYKEADDFLGDKTKRYFGLGYINSNHEVYNFILKNENNNITFSCLGKVRLPQQWSTKNATKQTPHLSTIDIIELTLLVADKLLNTVKENLVNTERSISEIIIKAGKSPVESDFHAIEITGDHVITNNKHIININIANMSIDVHYNLNNSNLIDSKIAPPSRKPLEIKAVMINEDELEASALVNISNNLSDLNTEALTISGLFAVGLQLGQILLYQLDHITRAESNTLWMKETKIQFLSDSQNVDNIHPIYTRLDKVKKYTKIDGDWRRADIHSIIENTRIICSVTHKLPSIIS